MRKLKSFGSSSNKLNELRVLEQQEAGPLTIYKALVVPEKGEFNWGRSTIAILPR